MLRATLARLPPSLPTGILRFLWFHPFLVPRATQDGARGVVE